MADLRGFLEPLAGPNVSGEELRNDPRFHAIERAAEPANRAGRIEAAKSGGTVQIDWSEILNETQALAATGRDLRLLVYAVRAMIAEDGFGGLAQGLDLLAETITRFWDTVHPLLRDGPTPRDAATRRINALYQIENAENGVLGDLEFHVFANLRLVGPVTGGDLAAGRLPRATVVSEAPRGLGEKELAAIVGAHETRVARVAAACKQLAAEQPDQFAALVAAVGQAQTSLKALEAALAAQLGEAGAGVRFLTLTTFLGRVADTLGAVESDAPAPQTEAPMNGTPSPAAPAPQAAPAASAIPGAINSRKDVERCLDMIIDFYERTEPSSPIPHLARRMRKMVPMNFLQLMEEIAPSGMKEFRGIAGVFDDKTK